MKHLLLILFLISCLPGISRDGNKADRTDPTTEFAIYSVDETFEGSQVMGCPGVPVDSLILDDFQCQRNLQNIFTTGQITVLPNPIPSAVNPSDTVARYVRSNSNFDVINADFLGGAIDLTTFNKIKMQVLAPAAGLNIVISLIDINGTNQANIGAQTSTLGQWEELVFDFSSLAANTTIDKLAILITPGDSAIGTYYLDNIRRDSSLATVGPCTGVVTDIKILEDFECQRNWGSLFPFGQLDLVANPASSPVNSSPVVAKYVRTNSLFDFINANFPGNTVDLTTFNKLKIKVFAPTNGINVVVSIIDDTGASIASVGQPTTTLGQWEELVYDFSAQAAVTNIERLSIFIDPNDSIPYTFFLDDVRMDSSLTALGPCNGVAADIKILEDFECQRNWEGLFPFGDLSLIANPTPSPVNPSAVVGKYVRTNSLFDFINANFPGNTVNLTTFNKFKMKVIAPAIGVNVVVSLIDNTGASVASVGQQTTTLGQWEELVFDFTAQAAIANIERMSIFIDPNDSIPYTFLIDDVRMDSSLTAAGPCSGVATDIKILEDFECQRNWQGVFPFGQLDVVANPSPAGINTSPVVGKYLRTNSLFDFINANFPGNTVNLSTFNNFKMKVIAPANGINVVVSIIDTSGTTVGSVGVLTANAGQWEELTYNFSAFAAVTTVERLSIFIDPNDSIQHLFYIDDVRMDTVVTVTGPCSGVVINPRILEDFECQRNWENVFPFGQLDVVANPTPAGINTSASVGKYQRTNSLFDFINANFPGSTVNLSTFNLFKMKVLAPSNGINVAVSIVDTAGTTVASAGVLTANAGQWEELTYDFSAFAAVTTVERLSIFIDPNDSIQYLFYIDDVRMDSSAVIVTGPCSGVVPNYLIVDDFECQRNLSNLTSTGTRSIISNPDLTGINTSDSVGRYIRSNGAVDTYTGTLVGGIQDLSVNNQLKIQLYSPVASIPVVVELLSPANTVIATGTQSVPVADQWVELNYGFPGLGVNSGVSQIRLSINSGTGVADTFLIDNIRFNSVAPLDICEGVVVDNTILEDFECQRNVTQLRAAGSLSIVANPVLLGINPSALVGQYDRTAGSTDAITGTFGLGSPNFTLTNNGITIDMLSTVANVGVELTLFNAAGTALGTAKDTIRTAFGWYKTGFSFNALAGNTAIASFSLKIGTGTATAGTFYLDNMRLGGVITSIEPNDLSALERFHFYPNPAQNQVTVEYTLETRSALTINLRDMMGREVAQLLREERPAGDHRFQWDLNRYAEGVYYLSIQVGERTYTERLIIKK